MPTPTRVPTAERLLALIAAMAGQPIVVAADLVADRFITGTPKRISREAPVLILSWEGERLVPGGGANAIANIAALGGRALPLGAVGDDESGRGLLADFRQRGVATGGIVVRPAWPTPTKTRILGGSRHGIKQQIVRFDVEAPRESSAEEKGRFEAFLSSLATAPRVCVVSDYGYGAATPDLVPLLRAHLGPEAILLVDSRYRLHEMHGLDGATPNEEEAEALLGRPLGETTAEASAAVAQLRERLGVSFLLVTRGSRGMVLATAEGAAHVPVHGTDQVADVTGAGDTVIGTFSLALAAGATPLEAALLADYAGGIVVMKMGTATLSREELAAAVLSDALPREALAWEPS
ncbi:MAG TPA: PfkB family carbohydrate kinase [Thermoanaerobaculia bacterium]|nr:PfkB family carbohydrate kinase [Thermoanaerobaculia bacterium]